MLSHAVRLLTLLLGLGLMGGPSIVQAGTVVSDSGNTVVTIGGKRDRLSGQYRSQVNGVTWTGSFDADARSQGVYVGNFVDRPINQPQSSCKGDVSLKLNQRSRFEPTAVDITWRVTGGQRCDAIGQRFTTKLLEALPKADSKGDYNDANARTYDGLNRKLIWPEWEVVSSDGKLNCRATPNGKVTFTFRSGERLNRMTASRDSHFQLDDAGASWLWIVPKQCYVRAKATLIAPLSDTPWN